MSDEVEKDIPDLPPEILEASENETLILFIGAGLSCAAGLGNWNDLKNELINNYNESDQGKKKGLRADWNNQTIFSIIKEKDFSTYEKVIENFLKPTLEMRKKFKSLYKIIENFKSISIVTLNVDPLLIECHPKGWGDFSFIGNCHPEFFPKKRLFHFHGIVDFDGGGRFQWVFNDIDYTKRYETEEAKRFLYNLFGGNYTILFLGFSFSDRELLEYAKLPEDIRKIIKQTNKPAHYALVPSDFNQEYSIWENYGIKTLKYKLNEDPITKEIDYINFEKTLHHWNQFISGEKAPMDLKNTQTPEEGPNGN